MYICIYHPHPPPKFTKTRALTHLVGQVVEDMHPMHFGLDLRNPMSKFDMVF